ncbi:hypothetical protein BTN50_0565 [Candidatus Enterovibrio altilux]|uniref:Uncharacterized protein n=1 Tax=Candidatus Enterovibrio altilux TaxID=1927128 RepID=A0A291B7W5_9GAMM|nr:hypothetical protein BTN50_0565 [Candidatus Enterovibrio luxaltus]
MRANAKFFVNREKSWFNFFADKHHFLLVKKIVITQRDLSVLRYE